MTIALSANVSRGNRVIIAIVLLGTIATATLIGMCYYKTRNMPTLPIAGITESREISPSDFGTRHIEGFARRWILRLANSHAGNYMTHAAASLPDCEPAAWEDLKEFFRRQNRLYEALDRSTAGEIVALTAQPIGQDLFRCDYTIALDTWYGSINTGHSTQSGSLIIRVFTNLSAPSPLLIASYQPGAEEAPSLTEMKAP